MEHDLDSAGAGASGGWTITIGDAEVILIDCQLGDSIAINGKLPILIQVNRPAVQE
jgi:riboflavin synthase alpha subunit